METVKLNTGASMPIIGLGTYLVKDKEVIMNIIDAALESGYRSIDTAQIYENEQFIAEALKKSLPKYNLKREDIFITSKLSHLNQGNKATAAIEESLKKLDTPYIDLMLIHFPGDYSLDPSDPKNRELRVESWKRMEDMKKDGRLKNIGVSNYTIKHLKEMIDKDSKFKADVIPAVNQVEFHPYLYQKDLLEFCKSNQICLEAYSSLGSQVNGDLLKDQVVSEIAKKHPGKTNAHILLRWAVQHGVIIIPKSKSSQRVKDNIKIFDFKLSSEEMKALDGLNKDKRFSWDPTNVV